MTDIYKAARDRIAADFDKAIVTTPRQSDTAELKERQKREWHRKARANYVAKNRDKIRAKAREYWRSKHPGCKIRGEYKHKEAA
jgi:hypothetical protein